MDHLSELVESTLSDLEESKYIEILNDDTEISPPTWYIILPLHSIHDY